MGCHFLLQRIFPTEGLNPCLLPWQVAYFTTEPLGNPWDDLQSALKKKKNHQSSIHVTWVLFVPWVSCPSAKLGDSAPCKVRKPKAVSIASPLTWALWSIPHLWTTPRE